jgi:hypothetical protein
MRTAVMVSRTAPQFFAARMPVTAYGHRKSAAAIAEPYAAGAGVLAGGWRWRPSRHGSPVSFVC